jgi:hypothetical protein
VTGTEAFAFFALEVVRACTQLGVTVPAVRPIEQHQATVMSTPLALAYIDPKFWWEDQEEVIIKWSTLWLYADNKKMLRCVARHEAAHLALGHGLSYTKADALEAENQANDLIVALWNETRNCGLVLEGVYEPRPQSAQNRKPPRVRLRTYQGVPLRTP